MANEKNLKPVRTKKEARERGRKGGKKSAEVRAKRKTLKEELLLLLETKNYNEKISLAMINAAAKGNVKAFLAVRDTIEENPKDKIEVSQDKPCEVNIKVKKR